LYAYREFVTSFFVAEICALRPGWELEKMQQTDLGKTGATVSVAGLGCGGHSRLGQASGASAQASAVVASAMLGTVPGSAAANAVTTGSFHRPGDRITREPFEEDDTK
jgi:hypothetical protein